MAGRAILCSLVGIISVLCSVGLAQDPPRAARAQELFNRSSDLYAAGKFNDSIAAIDEAIKIEPGWAELYRLKWLSMLKLDNFEQQVPVIRAEIEGLLDRSRNEKELREGALLAAVIGYGLIGDEAGQRKAEDSLIAEAPGGERVKHILTRRALDEQDPARQASMLEALFTRFPKSGAWMLRSILFRALAKLPDATGQRLLGAGQSWIKSAPSNGYLIIEAHARTAVLLAERNMELASAQALADEAAKIAGGLTVESPLLSGVSGLTKDNQIQLLKERANEARGFVLLRRKKIEEAAKVLIPALDAVIKQVEKYGAVVWKDMYLREVQVRPRVLWLAELYEAQGKLDLASKYLLAGYSDEDWINARIRDRLASVYKKLGRGEAAVESSLLDARQRFESLTVPTAAAREEERKKLLANRAARPAPDYQFTTLDKKSVRLAELRGKVVVLNFWATWCGPCLKEMPHFQRVAEKYKASPDVLLLAVSIDDNRALVRPYSDKNRFSFTVGYDEGGATVFGFTGIPATYFIDAGGVIQFQEQGFGGSADKYVERVTWRIDELLRQRSPAGAGQLSKDE